MKHKGYIILFILTLLLLFSLRYTYKLDSSKEITISTAIDNTLTMPPVKYVNSNIQSEKRGSPTYDHIIGTDGYPHYRVFFWVPKNSIDFVPYADKGVVTDVSEHGPVEKWSVVSGNKINKDEKLMFIYVPKTFIFFQGKGFENVIHLGYKNK